MNTAISTTSSPAGAPARAAALVLAAAGSLLAQASTASATTYNESSAPGGDFGNTFALRTTLTLGTTVVKGGILGSGSDPDFFTITGLASNAAYSLSIAAGDSTDGYSATFQGYNDAGTAIGTAAAYTASDNPGTVRTITGIVPASGILTIGVNPQTVPFVEGGSPVYTATLTAAVAPVPGSTSLVALGAAAAALAAARRGRKSADAAAE